MAPATGWRGVDRPLVIGIGRAGAGDDAAGLLVVERLPDEILAVTHDGEAASLLDLWQAHDSVIVVDAVLSDGDPGSVVLIDAIAEAIPMGMLRSTHALGLAGAIELGRAIGALPRCLLIVGIEGASFAPESPMSLPVARAMGTVVTLVEMLASGNRMIEALAHGV